jgi:uncharacterized protein YidB (DUF937 family)
MRMSDDNSGFPSMTALLGLLAIAGYQNRDKIAEMFGGLGQHTAPNSPTPPAAQPGSTGGLGGLLGSLGAGSGAGGFLNSGLGQLIDRFQQSGHGAAAQSWVNPGPNQTVGPTQVEQAIGPEVLSTLIQKTGLSRDELLARLSQELPGAVDKYTPDGRLPG